MEHPEEKMDVYKETSEKERRLRMACIAKRRGRFVVDFYMKYSVLRDYIEMGIAVMLNFQNMCIALANQRLK